MLGWAVTPAACMHSECDSNANPPGVRVVHCTSCAIVVEGQKVPTTVVHGRCANRTVVPQGVSVSDFEAQTFTHDRKW